MLTRSALAVGATAVMCLLGPAQARPAGHEQGWIGLFDGRSLDGWKVGENPASFRVADGCIVAEGPRAHLFYAGPVRGADFLNFDLKADVMTTPGSNSGLYFHTRYQEAGWPAQGYEVQINNSQRPTPEYYEFKKTGSLYGVRHVLKSLVRDNEWFTVHVTVRDKRVQVRLNDVLVVDYLEPRRPTRPADWPGRRLSHGTFALQCHDPASKVLFRNIRVRPLPDDAGADDQPPEEEPYADVLDLAAGLPVADLHVHLKGGLTIEEALRRSRQTGIFYGVAANCGLGFPITSDNGALAFLDSMASRPVFVAMQAEGREWVTMFKPETVARFDYVFTDAMTFTDDRGKRVRLWIDSEVAIADKQAFMDMLVARTVGILENEPIDVLANPTFLPKAIAAEYDSLWTEERMKKVIDAAARNGVAIEINARLRLPSIAFIKMARQAGVKFTFGTNNGDANLGALEYSLYAARQCGLTWRDMFIPCMQPPRAARR